jgi:hypothetical protein
MWRRISGAFASLYPACSLPALAPTSGQDINVAYASLLKLGYFISLPVFIISLTNGLDKLKSLVLNGRGSILLSTFLTLLQYLLFFFYHGKKPYSQLPYFFYAQDSASPGL